MHRVRITHKFAILEKVGINFHIEIDLEFHNVHDCEVIARVIKIED